MKRGPASQSCGLHVAELAGVPRDVVDRAREYLRRLERHQQTMLPASLQTELSFDPAHAEIGEELAKLDVDSLSPRAALELVYELARRARNSP